jgi:beta-aspartyl-peptidase (threonine type)
MEDDPTFDAGRGSFSNAIGEVELDAIIMDGSDLSFGAVAAVQRIYHPVTLAKLVMTETDHAMLTGVGAEAFARRMGLPSCSPEDLLVGRELERWQAAQQSGRPEAWDAFGKGPSGTVGAVAVDARGNVAAATSTGGTFNKLAGRVGDSPLVGCGAYADNHTGAVSATGVGEALMKIVASKSACDFMRNGLTAQAAAEAAIQVLAERTGGQGGVIVVSREGLIGLAHNTPYMAHAYFVGGNSVVAGIRCGEG